MKSATILIVCLLFESPAEPVAGDPIKLQRRFLSKTAKRDENTSNNLQDPALLDFFVESMGDAPPLVSNDINIGKDTIDKTTTHPSTSSGSPSTTPTGMNSEQPSMIGGDETIIPATIKITAATSTLTPTTYEPTVSPTFSPTFAPTTNQPSTSTPTTSKPTTSPTSFPSFAPTTSRPSTSNPTTHEPTHAPTAFPTFTPTTRLPTTSSPTTSEPTHAPTAFPSFAPTTSRPTTSTPTFSEPTHSPTALPSFSPTTSRPTTSSPTTSEPTTSPTATPNIAILTNIPFTSSPKVRRTESPSFTPTFPSVSATASEMIMDEITETPTVSPSATPAVKTTEIPIDDPSAEPTALEVTPSAVLGGIIWYDANANGIKDVGEYGVAGVTVQAKSCMNDQLIAIAFSDSEGNYRFRNVGLPGDCCYLQFPSDDDKNNTVTVPKDGRTGNIILGTEEEDLSWNAGVVFMVTSGSTVMQPSELPSVVTSIPLTSEPTDSPSYSPSYLPTTSQPTSTPPSTSEPTALSSFDPKTSHPSASTPSAANTTSAVPTVETSTSKFTTSISMTGEPTESPSDANTAQPTKSLTNQSTTSSPIIAEQENSTSTRPPSLAPTKTQPLASSQTTAGPTKSYLTNSTNRPTHLGSESPSSSQTSGPTKEIKPTKQPSKNPVDETSLPAPSSFIQPLSISPTTSLESPSLRTSRPSTSPTVTINEESQSQQNIVNSESSQTTSDSNNMHEELEGSDTTLIIMTVAGVATLTMLIIVFATQKRRKHEALEEPLSPVSNSSFIPCDIIDNQDRYVVSTVTGWNDHAHIELHDDVNDGPLPKSSELQSVAEINCKGTMTLEKECSSVLPGSWLNALHAGDSREAPSELEASSVDDTSTENFSDSNQGAFPTPVSKYLDSSHIGTLDEHDIEQASSQETEESKSSLNRFISDLVWLEQKIADENAQEATEVIDTEEKQVKNDELQQSDSYSYECEPFSPRSLSDTDSIITSASNSRASSIVCRDCHFPPGLLDIEITSTKDGPIISGIRDDSLLGHLNVGDLIMALDDRDTRSLTADQMAAALSSRSTLQRKLTLLHFGGVRN